MPRLLQKKNEDDTETIQLHTLRLKLNKYLDRDVGFSQMLEQQGNGAMFARRTLPLCTIWRFVVAIHRFINFSL